MLDFTSALYLGMQHSSESLRPWAQLTTGRPVALGAPDSQRRVAQGLAKLIGCQSATMGTSTLHLFWDLFGLPATDGIAVCIDSGAYPIACWGAERAAAHGAPVRLFEHHDPDALRQLLNQRAFRHRRPIVLTDGFCPSCGAAAPLGEYLEIIRAYGGHLVIDDTQSLGIFGRPHRRDTVSFGQGGGGSLHWQNVHGPEIVVISSLAKGFGAPIAVLAGSREMVERFAANSETRVHTSPPSAAAIHAAEHALVVNRKHGDRLRSHLTRLIRQFRKQLARLGLSTTGGVFPVQMLRPMPEGDAQLVHKRLHERGVRTVLQQPRCQRGAVISFLITVLHWSADIEWAARVLAKVLRNTGIKARIKMEKDYEPFEYGFRTV